MKRLSSWFLAGVLLFAAVSAFAQAYPNRAIRFMVGFPAGSSIDLVSRIVLDDVRARTGAVVAIENRPGGAYGTL